MVNRQWDNSIIHIIQQNAVRHRASQSGIWADERRQNFIVRYVNSEQFTIIGLLIRPFPEKTNTKSLFSMLVIVLVIAITQKKMMKKHLFIATSCT